MTTYYLDPVGGNDASAGTSFATRVQSITTGIAAKAAPGDTVRVIQSANATSLGQTASWIDGSRIVTLTSAVTAPVTAATAAWTTVANTTSTTSTNRKLGSTSSSLTVSANFTTGKSHYTTVSQADYSAYQQLTFWIMQTSGTLASADGEITLKLCSDTLGATAVNTFNVPRIRALNTWQAYTIDNGSALGSSIQSIALYVNTDRAAQTFLINHVSAVKASSASDSLSLVSLIGKNTGSEGWFDIESISGTAVTLATASGGYNLSTSGTPSGYAGVTETVTTYKRENLRLPSSMVGSTQTGASTWGTIGNSGASAAAITFSGGWNSSDMTAQVGDTYFDGVNGFGYGLYVNGQNYITFDRLNPSGFYAGLWINGAVVGVNAYAKDISSNYAYNIVLQNAGDGLTGPSSCVITANNVNCAGSVFGIGIELFRSVKGCNLNVTNLNSNWSSGFVASGDSATSNPFVISQIKGAITTVRRNGGSGVFIANMDRSDMTFATLSNSASNQIGIWGTDSTNRTPGVSNSRFTVSNSIGFAPAFTAALSIDGGRNNSFYLNGATILSSPIGVYALRSSGSIVYGGTYSGNTTHDIEVDGGSDLTIVNAVVSSSPVYAFWETGSGKLTFQKYNGTASDHRTYYPHGSITSNSVTTHSGSGISWAISPTDTVLVTSDSPMVLPLGVVACAAGSLVTATVYVNRTSTGLTTQLVAKGGQLAGVPTDVVATAAGAAGSWEQLTVTFMPSEAGTIEFEARGWGGTTATVYIDDFAVAQP